MSPPRARTWRAYGALAIWSGVLLAFWLLLIGMMRTISDTAQRDGSLTGTALVVGSVLVAAGIVIRVRVPPPDD